ncbi:MAG: tetraacyldisaccharide 4'-kinase [Crocinitomicaceae bacterium]|nr:tetraacyldisaccharide 4'-kinase [Crocinitomicaceae bacterium]
MNLIRFIFFPFSLIYGLIILIRNFLFKKGFRKGVAFDLPIICIGNLSTGGTGKTPHTELIIEKLSEQYQIGVLSRGYKRLTKGYVQASPNSTWEDVGDEPLQYFFKFGKKVSVQVAEERIEGVIRIAGDQPKTELILLDDAYQHRSIKAGFNILLTDYSRPFFSDFILPVGDLREFRSGKNRADYIVMTKCPKNLSEEEKMILTKRIQPNSIQKVFFSSINYKGIFNFDGQKLESLPENILLVTGIAKPKPILDYLKGKNVKHLEYPDHYRFKARDIEKITDLFDNFAAGNKIILTTVKDLMRLRIFKKFCEDYQNEIHYLDISIEIDNEKEFLQGIINYVESNKRNDSVH